MGLLRVPGSTGTFRRTFEQICADRQYIKKAVARGRSVKEIAEDLGLGINYVAMEIGRAGAAGKRPGRSVSYEAATKRLLARKEKTDVQT